MAIALLAAALVHFLGAPQGAPSAVASAPAAAHADPWRGLLDRIGRGESPLVADLLAAARRGSPDSERAFFESLAEGRAAGCAACAAKACPHLEPRATAAWREFLKRLPDALRAELHPAGVPTALRGADLACAMRLLGRVGADSDVAAAVRAADAAEPEPDGAPSPWLAGLAAMAREVLARDASAAAPIAALVQASRPAAQVALLEALGSVPRPETADALARLSARAPALDPAVLAQIGRIGAQRRAAVSVDVVLRVRSALGSQDVAARREAALAVGRLRDDAATPTLVELLDGDLPGVRENALWSLREITGVRFGLDAPRWRRWLEREDLWWTERAPDLFARIENGTAAEAVDALRDVARRRLERAEIARRSVVALQRSERPVLVEACLTLAALKSTVAVAPLIEVLEHGDAAVRSAAWEALKAISGEDRPPDAASWREYSRGSLP